MTGGTGFSEPGWKPGKFKELSIEGLQTNLEIIVTRLKAILKGPKKKINADETYKLSNALSGLIRTGLHLQDAEQQRQAMLEQVREEFALIAKQEFQKYPALLEQIDSISSTIKLTD
jgi:hypothetical protein